MKTKTQLALTFASNKHDGQTRSSNNNEPYINHIMRVYNTLIDFGYKDQEDVLVAALLHDTVEDTDTTYAEICNLFGPIVMNYVLQLTNTVSSKEVGRTAYHEANHFRIVNACSAVKVIKMADMIDNLSDITETFNPKFAKKYLDEKSSIVKEFRYDFIDHHILHHLEDIIEKQYAKLKNGPM